MNKQTLEGSQREVPEMHSLPRLLALQEFENYKLLARSFFLLGEKMLRHIKKKPWAFLSHSLLREPHPHLPHALIPH